MTDADLIDGFVMRKGVRIPVKILRPPGQPVRRRSKSAFAILPLHWITELAKAKRIPTSVLLISLLFAAWEAKGQPFIFSKEKLIGRCSRATKMRFLSELEAIGWIKVERKGKGAPVVTFLKG
jgi:hypothetical protein